MDVDIDNEKKLMLLFAATTAAFLFIRNKQCRKKVTRRYWAKQWLKRRNEGKGVVNMLQYELLTEDISVQNFFKNE